jgi:hypothetical protein
LISRNVGAGGRAGGNRARLGPALEMRVVVHG